VHDDDDGRTMSGMSASIPPPDPAAPPVAPTEPSGSPAPTEPAAATTAGAPGGSRRRPFALVVLAGLMLLRAALIALVVVGLFYADPETFAALPLPDLINDQERAILLALVLVPLVILLTVSGLGLLAFRRSGWLIAMIVTGMFVLFDIVGWFLGEQSDVWMLLNVITVFYLNQRDVRELVGDVAPAGHVAGEPA
jgi:hypothetical protein